MKRKIESLRREYESFKGLKTQIENMRKLNNKTFASVEPVMDQLYARITSLEEIIKLEAQEVKDENKLFDAYGKLGRTEFYFESLTEEERGRFEHIFENTKDEVLLKDSGWHAAYHAFLSTESLLIDKTTQKFLGRYDLKENARIELRNNSKAAKQKILELKKDDPNFNILDFYKKCKEEKAEVLRLGEEFKPVRDPYEKAVEGKTDLLRKIKKNITTSMEIKYNIVKDHEKKIKSYQKVFKDLKENKDVYQQLESNVTETYEYYQELLKKEKNSEAVKNAKEEWEKARDEYYGKVAPIIKLAYVEPDLRGTTMIQKEELKGFSEFEGRKINGFTFDYSILKDKVWKWLEQQPKNLKANVEYNKAKPSAAKYVDFKTAYDKEMQKYDATINSLKSSYDEKKEAYKTKYDKFKAKEAIYNKINEIRADVKNIEKLQIAYRDAFKEYADNNETIVNNDIQRVAKKLLRTKSLHQGTHKNTVEYDRMINALEEVARWPKDKDNNDSQFATLKDAVKNWKTQSENYLKAKNEQKRWIPSVMRRHRMEYANVFIELASASLDDKELVEQENIRVDKLEKETQEKESKEAVEPVKESELMEIGLEM